MNSQGSGCQRHCGLCVSQRNAINRLGHARPTATYVYDIGPNLLSMTDPRGVTTSCAYDALNRLVTRIDAFSAPTTLPGLNQASPVMTCVYDAVGIPDIAEADYFEVTSPDA